MTGVWVHQPYVGDRHHRCTVKCLARMCRSVCLRIGCHVKPNLRFEMRPVETQELQLICNCCGQPYYPDKAWEDRLRAIVFGAEKYANCPSCTQQVSEDVLSDSGYRQRCDVNFEKWRRMFEAQRTAKAQEREPSGEPTYDELKAQVEWLARQVRGRLQFKVGEKGGVSVYGLGRFPVTLYYEQWERLLDVAQRLRDFLETNRAKLSLKERR